MTSKDKNAKTEESAKSSKKTASSRGLGRGLSALMSDIGSVHDLTAPSKTDAKKETRPKQEAGAKQEEAKTQSPETARAETPQASRAPAPKSRNVATLAIDQIVRNPDQPRRFFDKALLEELTQSITDKGVLQPILVRPVPPRGGVVSGKPVYQIVAGERRWQASLKAGLTSMPALIRELSDQDVLEIGVVENVQRAELNPIEEALAYQALNQQFGRTQDDIAKAIGKSRPHISNMLRLLTLPKRAQDALQSGKITTGHARAIIAAPDPDVLVEHIIDKQLSVRDAEAWVRRIKTAGQGEKLPPARKAQKTADIEKIEKTLTDITGVRVDLKHKNPGGEIRLKYKNEKQLAMVLALLGYDS